MLWQSYRARSHAATTRMYVNVREHALAATTRMYEKHNGGREQALYNQGTLSYEHRHTQGQILLNLFKGLIFFQHIIAFIYDSTIYEVNK